MTLNEQGFSINLGKLDIVATIYLFPIYILAISMQPIFLCSVSPKKIVFQKKTLPPFEILKLYTM